MDFQLLPQLVIDGGCARSDYRYLGVQSGWEKLQFKTGEVTRQHECKMKTKQINNILS